MFGYGMACGAAEYAVATGAEGCAYAAACGGVRGVSGAASNRRRETVVTRSMSDRQFTMYLLSAFAAFALVLAAVGLYSVLAYGVRRRVREIGIRMALGAGARGVVRMVVADALRPTLIGIVVGLAAAVAIRRVIASFLFGVQPGDPATFAAVAGLLLVVALAASALPAYSATRIDPNLALRDE